MIIEKLKKLKQNIVDLFQESMEFKAFTSLAYMFANEYSQEDKLKNATIHLAHSEYSGKVKLSDQTLVISEIPKFLDKVQNKYFFSLVHQQQVSLFENLFFDIIKIILDDRPERLSDKKQINYKVIFESETKEELLGKLVDRELNEIKYKNVSQWFEYLESLINIGKISQEKIEKISEAKAARDILVHNSGKVNQIYIDKSGNAARFKIGDQIDMSGEYTLNVWTLFIEVLTENIDLIISKLEKR